MSIMLLEGDSGHPCLQLGDLPTGPSTSPRQERTKVLSRGYQVAMSSPPSTLSLALKASLEWEMLAGRGPPWRPVHRIQL